MNKYLAIFYGAASQDDKQQITPEESQAFMEAWAAWATRYQDAFIDPGTPLAATKRVTADGVSDTHNNQTGYAIVQAESHEVAAAMFCSHPHVSLFPGNAVEIMECPPVPIL